MSVQKGCSHTPLRALAYITSSTIPSRAANAVHVLNMSAGFAEQGQDVTLFARGDPRPAAPLLAQYGIQSNFSIDLTPLRRPALLDRLRFLQRLRSRFASAAFDFAYGRSCYALLWGVPAATPLAYDLHSLSSHPVQRRLEARLFRRPNFLFATAISRALADAYEAAYPHLAGRLVVTPCAASVPNTTADETSRGNGSLRVYYVGHLYQGRGIDLILAVASLQPGMDFHIVGGEEADIARWREQAPANVTFHGYVKPADLPRFYAAADVCLSPHQRQVAGSGGGDIASWTSPMKLFEYMSHGKAILASDLPAIREILSHEDDALLCPPEDPQAWSAALERLRSDAELHKRLGQAAARKLREKYTWDARARRILDEATRLIAQRQAS